MRPRTRLAVVEKVGEGKVEEGAKAPPFCSKFERPSSPRLAGYDVDTGGFTFRVDYRFNSKFRGWIGLYATVFGNGFYLGTVLIGGPSGYTALQGTASGSTDGVDVNVLVAGGYDWKEAT
jgi:hypothetical protein